jgi:hypothetical protein
MGNGHISPVKALIQQYIEHLKKHFKRKSEVEAIMAELNSALQVGDFTIKNRLVLAPLTSA